MLTKKQITLAQIITLIILAVIVSIFSANRSDKKVFRNDTHAYYSHYNCSTSLDKIAKCKREIGSSTYEIGYDVLPVFFQNLLGGETFWYYKLFIALFINIGILVTAYLLSNRSLLPPFLILLDYRFYAFSSNIIRHGLALTLSLISVYVFLNRKKISSLLLTLLAMMFHNSAFAFLIKTKVKINGVILLFILALSFSTVQYLPELIMANKELLFGFNEKLIGYSENYGSESIIFPLHYFFVMVIGVFFYKKTKKEDYVVIYNSLFVLVLLSIAFSAIGIADRIIAFMTPLVYVLFYYIYRESLELLNKKSHKYYFLLYYIIIIFGLFILFIRNLDMLFVHLN
ncbi:EpsG family protein [Vibrio splendidus]